MKEKKVSIIVPVHNVESYLGRCIESLVEQTYRNIEIILIDDKSTDNSLELCISYRERDSRIVVEALEENLGAAAARIQGLSVATGDYFMFADGDDWMHRDMVSGLMKGLEKSGADVIQCGFVTTDGTSSLEDINDSELIIYDNDEAIRQLYGEGKRGGGIIFCSGINYINER